MNQYRWMSALLGGLLWIGWLVPGMAAAQDKPDKPDKPRMIDLWQSGDSGQRMRIRGRVTSTDGRPVPYVKIGIRHADSEGMDWSYHQGVVTTNEKGVYQFGSVIPGNSHRLSHVHVTISHEGYQYVDTEFHFKDDPKVLPGDPDAIFLEEGNVGGKKMMFGRYDITLIPE